MPRILHYSPADLVGQLRVQQPLAIYFIVAPCTFANLVANHGGLSTAKQTYGCRHRLAREQG